MVVKRKLAGELDGNGSGILFSPTPRLDAGIRLKGFPNGVEHPLGLVWGPNSVHEVNSIAIFLGGEK